MGGSLDSHRRIGDTVHVCLLVGNDFLFPHQGDTFLCWFATGYISLRNSWAHRPDKNCYVERLHRTYKEECLLVHRPATVEQVREVTEQFRAHYNQERPHQGRACGNVPPRMAYPVLPTLPPVPAQVDPDRWLQSLQGGAFVRTVRSDGTVSVDDVRYYVSRDLAGRAISLIVNASDKVFEVLLGVKRIKRLPIKGLYGQLLPFEEYVTLMRQEAHSDGHRPRLTHHSFQQ